MRQENVKQRAPSRRATSRRRSGVSRRRAASPGWRRRCCSAWTSCIVAAILGPADAAVYAAATRFLVLGQLGNQAISAPVEPRLSGLLARRDIAGAQDVYRLSTAWLICVNWPIFLRDGGVCADDHGGVRQGLPRRLDRGDAAVPVHARGDRASGSSTSCSIIGRPDHLEPVQHGGRARREHRGRRRPAAAHRR